MKTNRLPYLLFVALLTRAACDGTCISGQFPVPVPVPIPVPMPIPVPVPVPTPVPMFTPVVMNRAGSSSSSSPITPAVTDSGGSSSSSEPAAATGYGRGMLDIGHFGHHDGSPGVEYLRGEATASAGDALSLMGKLGGLPDSRFLSIPDAQALTMDHMARLRKLVDEQWDGEPDFKLELSHDVLSQILGPVILDGIAARFPGNFDTIKLRRCQSHGNLINFHTDFANVTMQIALNDDDEYVGGRLVYATADGLVAPPRPAGSITVHDNKILHGVTRLESGVRYALFLQRTKEAVV